MFATSDLPNRVSSKETLVSCFDFALSSLLPSSLFATSVLPNRVSSKVMDLSDVDELYKLFEEPDVPNLDFLPPVDVDYVGYEAPNPQHREPEPLPQPPLMVHLPDFMPVVELYEEHPLLAPHAVPDLVNEDFVAGVHNAEDHLEILDENVNNVVHDLHNEDIVDDVVNVDELHNEENHENVEILDVDYAAPYPPLIYQARSAGEYADVECLALFQGYHRNHGKNQPGPIKGFYPHILGRRLHGSLRSKLDSSIAKAAYYHHDLLLLVPPVVVIPPAQAAPDEAGH